jgi:hypothetical protein
MRVAPIGHDIDPAARHEPIQEDVDGRDKPGHDGGERVSQFANRDRVV